MATANFFDKAALAASHIIRGFSYEDFLAHLNQETISLAYDKDAITRSEGLITLELSVNLLARLYPRICLTPLQGDHSEISEKLANMARAINPRIELDSEPTRATATLCVGSTQTPHTNNTIYAGSHGWLVRLNSSSPAGSGNSANPTGAAAAACFGAANLFRSSFRAHLPDPRLDDFELSILTLDFSDSFNPPLPDCDLSGASIVGLGAIGNAALWTLSKATQLKGEVTLIDSELVELSNLQRYVLTTQETIDQPKVKVAQQCLSQTDLQALAYECTWEQYLSQRVDWQIEAVAVAVDSAEDRRSIQASLPRWIVNSWTQPGNLGISRHSFDSEHPCLCCMYYPTGRTKNEDELISESLGIPADFKEIRSRIQLRTPTDREFIEKVASAVGISAEPLLRFEGASLRKFYTEVACGGLILRLGGSAKKLPQAAEVPMAFQSALAGVLLASELIAYLGGLRKSPPPAQNTIDLLRPIGSFLSSPIKKAVGCICQDPDYLRAYREKYNL